jgi:hypothetical protein
MDIIKALEGAKTKDELEDLGIEHLGVDIDKRKSKEVMRAELLAEAEDRAESAGLSDPKPPEELPPELQKVPKGRMARNKTTGRIMPWTASMAKFSHMEEV